MAGLLPDLGNYIKNTFAEALGQGESTKSASVFNPAYPWDISDKQDIFWKPVDIKGERWNRLFPYRLLVIDIKEPSKIYGSGNSRGRSSVSYQEGLTTITQFLETNGTWEFNLPISPQQLQITDHYAINTTATMRGIVEEHNGVKFKTITASGTTGVWPRRPTVGGVPKAENSLQTIFAGAVDAFEGVIKSTASVAKAFSGDHPANVTTSDKPDQTIDGLEGTGYFQAMMLGQFIERYAQEKKKPQNKDLRLVFDMPKQNKSFIVTPVQYASKQSEQKPSEHLWSFQLKAWKRVDLRQPAKAAPIEIPGIADANVFQRIINTIGATRRLLGDSIDLVKAVRSDFQKPFNVLRQATLAIKDLGGLNMAVADLPRNIINDAQSSIEGSLFNVQTAFTRGPSSGGASGDESTLIPSAISLKSTSSQAKAGAAINSIVARNAANEGLSAQAVADGALGSEAAQSQKTDPMASVFENPEEYFELFDGVDLDSLSLSIPQQNAVDDELERVRLIDIEQFREFKKEIIALALDISNNYGAGDEVFAEVYGRSEPSTRVTAMTIQENEILVALMDTVQMFDIITSTKVFDDDKVDSPLEFVGGLADESGIDFDQSQSKFLAPVPFGLTIEEIAARYLGDPDKFLEIATLNNLKSPYIDEEGFVFELLSNADGRQFNVDNTTAQMYVGQQITLSSSTVPAFTRRVISIENIGEANDLVSVDGLSDLDNLKTADSAQMRGYLPGTVNSQNQIYIPTSAPADEDDRTFEITYLDQPVLTKISKVDFLLDDEGDIALNSIGDFRLANGLTNLIQALKLKIQTKRGTLLRHLDYGIGLKHGMSVADLDTGLVIEELNRMIQDDPRFSSINRIDIALLGTTLTIDMSVSIANGTGVVPVSFNLKL